MRIQRLTNHQHCFPVRVALVADEVDVGTEGNIAGHFSPNVVEVINAKPEVSATAGDGVAILGDVEMAATSKKNRAQVPLTLELAEILIAALAVGDSGTETKRQGEQQTPTMPSDKAHALLHE
jgi:hypothetical protein